MEDGRRLKNGKWSFDGVDKPLHVESPDFYCSWKIFPVTSIDERLGILLLVCVIEKTQRCFEHFP